MGTGDFRLAASRVAGVTFVSRLSSWRRCMPRPPLTAASGNDSASYATLTSNSLETAPFGRFQIAIDWSAAPGNQMQFPDDGDFMFSVRDSLSNWKQIPAELIMGATPPTRLADDADQEVAARGVSHKRCRNCCAAVQ